MSHITIKRPSNIQQVPTPAHRTPMTPARPGHLTQVGELRHGIHSQHSTELVDSGSAFMRTARENTNYLAFAKEKNLSLELYGGDDSFENLQKRNLLENEKKARKGHSDFLNHVTNYIKRAARSGASVVQMDIAELIDSFRRYRQPSRFDPHEHTRNLALWIATISGPQQSNIHVTLGREIIKGLRHAGYTKAKLETKYLECHSTLPSSSPDQNSVSDKIAAKISSFTPSASSQKKQSQTVAIPYDVITVATECTKKPNLSKLVPKTLSEADF